MVISSCKHSPPKHELCIPSADSSYLLCEDPRLDDEEYERQLTADDIVTNIEDYNHVRAWVLDKLDKCEGAL